MRCAFGRLGLLLLSFAVIAWVVQVEYRHASIQIGSSVPAIPALAVLLLLIMLARFGRRRGVGSSRTARTEADARDGMEGLRRGSVVAYLALVIAAAVPSTPSMVYLFGQMTAAQAQADRPGMRAVLDRLPKWLTPPAGRAIDQFYRGTQTGAIPWNVWLTPLLAWGIFLLTLMMTLAAALALFRRSWMEHERLAYPMVQIPLRIVSGEGAGRGATALFWLGFGATAVLDGLNMWHAFQPSVPALGAGYDVGLFFPDRPWSALSPMWVSYRPEIFGLAYLMPGDVLLTAWLSYVLLRLSTVARAAAGSQIASTPYDYQELGMGAFLALFVVLVLRAWPRLKASFWSMFQGGCDDRHEAMSTPVAWLLVLGGPVVLISFLVLAGFPLWVASFHLFLLLAVAIVYARIRCETGTPSVYLFPFWQQQSLLTNLFGVQPLTGAGGRGLVGMALFGGLSRGVYPELSAYAAEGMSLAAQTGAPQRRAMKAFVTGAALGLICGGLLYLSVCYQRGADNIGGGYQLGLMRQSYQQVAGHLGSSAASLPPPRPELVFETMLGAVIALGLNGLRQRVLWFPLHPVGFAMTSAYGYHLWFPFLTAWILKSLILRFGGHQAFARFIPCFLGIAMGRYLFTGIVWGLLGLTGHPATHTYHIHFS